MIECMHDMIRYTQDMIGCRHQKATLNYIDTVSLIQGLINTIEFLILTLTFS